MAAKSLTPPHGPDAQPDVVIRRARTGDVAGIRALVAPLAAERVLVAKEAVSYFESIQEFRVAEDAEGLLACGAVHVMWEDLAEVRTLAVDGRARGQGLGGRLLESLLDDARSLGVTRVFCLTFEVDFFARHGFEVMSNQDDVDPAVYAELLRSHDEGVAEFLDLARVKPNTLGNTRMIRRLS
ncbi:amino-acid N-acetyltransferase [Falsarthrobacter nasiphocae]|uniref:Amino-acid N-acetyltransferase n=1 Tax=Falsarthrobacter nasiphocae TaxID=189863 RepID=A0AAE3YH79_9MICC|nr:amino-acid N-acetyltransferase [Falsarthrobacter nasiphocae]MDR6891956.1 amino-acid N-acetyltransferase [Falsarthrobacter nasiphocae]